MALLEVCQLFYCYELFLSNITGNCVKGNSDEGVNSLSAMESSTGERANIKGTGWN